MRTVTVLAAACVAMVASAAQGSFFDDFESYTTTAQMNAPGAWGDDGGGGLGTLDTATGNPGQSMYHPAGTCNLHLISPLVSERIV